MADGEAVVESSFHCVFVVHGLGAGGTERVVTRLTSWILEHEVGIEPSIITIDDTDNDFYATASVPRKRLWREGRPPGDIRATVHRLRKALDDDPPDVVVAMGSFSAVAVLAATTLRPWPVIVSEQNEVSSRRSAPVRIGRWLLYRRAAAAVVLTQASRARVERWTSRANVHVIPNAVDPSTVPTSQPMRSSRTLLSVGSLTEQKGHDLLIQAFAQAIDADDCDGWQLKIVGDGPLRDELAALVTQFGVDRRVVLEPAHRDIHVEYRDAAAFVLPSRWEGFGLVLIEAMASGLPIVATATEGPRSIITDGEDGLLVPSDDVDALSGAICRLVGDAALRQQLGVAATLNAQSYGEAQVFPIWTRLLAAVAGPPTGGSSRSPSS